jgi:hypothetical protein
MLTPGILGLSRQSAACICLHLFASVCIWQIFNWMVIPSNVVINQNKDKKILKIENHNNNNNNISKLNNT